LKISDFVEKGATGLLSVYQDTNLLEMLMLFQAHSVRIALICDEKKKINTGIPSIMYTVFFSFIIEKRYDYEKERSQYYWRYIPLSNI
jgi:hypothetical protein